MPLFSGATFAQVALGTGLGWIAIGTFTVVIISCLGGWDWSDHTCQFIAAMFFLLGPLGFVYLLWALIANFLLWALIAERHGASNRKPPRDDIGLSAALKRAGGGVHARHYSPGTFKDAEHPGQPARSK